MKPIIGVTSAWSYETWADSEKESGNYYVGKQYVQAVLKAGGLPVILHPSIESEDLYDLMNILDGLLFTGGGSATKFTPENMPSLEEQQPVRYSFEKELMIKAHNMNKPILGICRGYQMMIQVFGGTLSQDVISGHKQSKPYHIPHHKVVINKDSILYNIIQEDEWDVNSIHVQQLDKLPEDFIVSARTEDNVIEGIESINKPLLMGFQFHPELLLGDEKSKVLFEYFIKEAIEYKVINNK